MRKKELGKNVGGVSSIMMKEEKVYRYAGDHKKCRTCWQLTTIMSDDEMMEERKEGVRRDTGQVNNRVTEHHDCSLCIA